MALFITYPRALAGKKFAVVHNTICALTLFSSISVQANSISGSVSTAIDVSPEVIGVVILALVFVITMGGLNGISKFTSKCVPIMSVSYLFIGLLVICANIENVPEAFASIFTYAFKPIAAAGGFAGAAVATVIRMGVARGLYSNDAGNGAAAINHGAAITPHPSAQGLWGIFEVFVDTIVICTITALILITTDAWQVFTADNAAAMPGYAVSTALTFDWGSIVVAVEIFFFALTTILMLTFAGQKRWEFLFGLKAAKLSKYFYLIAILVGSFSSLIFVWSLNDILFVFIVVPNIIVLIKLSSEIKSLTDEYKERYIFGQKKR